MKQVLFVCLSIFSLAGFSQKQITVEEIPRAVSKGTQPSYFVAIPQATIKEVEKNWLKYARAIPPSNPSKLSNEDAEPTLKRRESISAKAFFFSELSGAFLRSWVR